MSRSNEKRRTDDESRVGLVWWGWFNSFVQPHRQAKQYVRIMPDMRS